MPLTSSSIRSRAISPSPGAREQRWFYEHEAEMVAQYGGRWIAVSGDTVLGAGDEANDAYRQAESRGFPNAVVILVPEQLGELDNLFF